MYNVQLKWLTVTCFEMRFGDITVVSDPFIGGNPRNDLTWEDIERCDIITLSHCHWDHITDIPKLLDKFPAPLLTGTLTAMPMLRWLNCNPSRVYPMDANLELDFGALRIKALFGRHMPPPYKDVTELEAGLARNPVCQADPMVADMQVLGSLEYRNYLFTTKDGVRVLLWGNDTTPTQVHMVAEQKPDICILQLTGHDPIKIAHMAAQSGCKVLIPHHMDLAKSKEEYMPKVLTCKAEFERLVPDGKLIVPVNGEWISL